MKTKIYLVVGTTFGTYRPNWIVGAFRTLDEAEDLGYRLNRLLEDHKALFHGCARSLTLQQRMDIQDALTPLDPNAVVSSEGSGYVVAHTFLSEENNEAISC